MSRRLLNARFRGSAMVPAVAAGILIVVIGALGLGRARSQRAFQPGLRPARLVKPTRSQVSVWMPYWEMGQALATVERNPATIGVASPFWYQIDGTDRIVDRAGAGAPAVTGALAAHHVKIVPTVTEGDGMAAFARVLASASRRAAMIRALVRIAGTSGYAGLDLDFENLAVAGSRSTALAGRVAAGYAPFVAQACRALHRIRRSCVVTVMASTGSRHDWHGTLAKWVYDYRTLAAAADRMRVMAYDEHYPGGPPGPVAPLPWVRRVLGYVLSQVPAAKLELGIPAYGYDWSGRSAVAVLGRDAPALAARHHVQPRWDPQVAEETFSYRSHGVRHIVWYEDARANLVRARLAFGQGLAGIDFWAAGYEDPRLWHQLLL